MTFQDLIRVGRFAGLLSALLSGSAASPVSAAPSACTLAENTTITVQGVYGGSWGRDSGAQAGSMLGCRALPGASVWSGAAGSPDGFVGAVARSFQLRFVTSDAAGRKVPATGLLLVPKPELVPGNQAGRAPVIAIASGTIGVADACAPSRTVRNGSSSVEAWVTHYLAKGLTVLVVDYLGLGTQLAEDGRDHPYLEAESSAHVVLDALRAARQVPGGHYASVTATIPSSWPVAVSGYSQGGFSALWATLRAPSYAPELPLRASVVGAPPVDLKATFLQIDDSIARSLFAYVLLGFANATNPNTLSTQNDNETHLSTFLTERGRALISQARSTCAAELATNNALDTVFGADELEDLVNRQALLEDERFNTWLTTNSILVEGAVASGLAAPQSPVFAFHGSLDGVVPYTPTRNLFRDVWGAEQGSAIWTGDADLKRAPLVFQPAAVGAHLTTSPLERNDGASGSRYTPYEWVWDSLFSAARSEPDLTP